MSDIILVIPHDFRFIIEKHPKWELDMGRKYSNRNAKGDMEVAIQDQFVLEFFSETNTLCYKVGRMGSLSFYTSFALPDNQVWLYNEDAKVSMPFQKMMLQANPEKYIASLVMALEEATQTEEEE
jgi:hypothetical protein